jgi:hypothetical protein
VIEGYLRITTSHLLPSALTAYNPSSPHPSHTLLSIHLRLVWGFGLCSCEVVVRWGDVWVMVVFVKKRYRLVTRCQRRRHYTRSRPACDSQTRRRCMARAADKTSGQQEHDTMSKSNEAQGEPQPQAELLKRVLSSGSNTSKGSQTPTKSTIPLSPASPGGARTPRAT